MSAIRRNGDGGSAGGPRVDLRLYARGTGRIRAPPGPGQQMTEWDVLDVAMRNNLLAICLRCSRQPECTSLHLPLEGCFEILFPGSAAWLGGRKAVQGHVEPGAASVARNPWNPLRRGVSFQVLSGVAACFGKPAFSPPNDP